MLNFYPGPSRINYQVEKIIQKALKSNILEFNHRSPEFEFIFKSAVQNIRNYLKVPQDYDIHFVSSATECWEIIAQSFTPSTSTHVYNGAFGKKWAEKAELIGKTVHQVPFSLDDSPLLNSDLASDVICFTSCETSNGSQLNDSVFEKTKRLYPESLIAIDATASLGGYQHNIASADIWFASVQKCFGLPAGLAIMICSPEANRKAESLNETNHYNSYLNILKNSRVNQTTHTPNILDIYLLSEMVFQELDWINQDIQKRASHFISSINTDLFSPLIKNDSLRSDTVICLTSKVDMNTLFLTAKEHNIVLGKGYGEWKNNTFRVANFPSHKKHHFDSLIDFLSNF